MAYGFLGFNVRKSHTKHCTQNTIKKKATHED